jgi:hypothetical protein
MPDLPTAAALPDPALSTSRMRRPRRPPAAPAPGNTKETSARGAGGGVEATWSRSSARTPSPPPAAVCNPVRWRPPRPPPRPLMRGNAEARLKRWCERLGTTGRYQRRWIVREQRCSTVKCWGSPISLHVSRGGLRLGRMEMSRGGERGSVAG